MRAKLAAMSAAVFVLMAAPLLVLYGGALLGGLPFWHNTRDLLDAVLEEKVREGPLASAVLAYDVLRRRGQL